MIINGVSYGDSLSGTSGITSDQTLAARIEFRRPQDTWTYESTGALMADAAIANFVSVVNPHFDSSPGITNVVILWSIGHGEANDTFETPIQIYDKMKTLVELAQTNNWQVAITTIPATTEYNDPGSSPYRREERRGYNQLLRYGDGGSRPRAAGAEFLIDVEMISGLNNLDVPISGNPGGTLIQSDGIHLTAAGQDACADLAVQVLENRFTFTFGFGVI